MNRLEDDAAIGGLLHEDVDQHEEDLESKDQGQHRGDPPPPETKCR